MHRISVALAVIVLFGAVPAARSGGPARSVAGEAVVAVVEEGPSLDGRIEPEEWAPAVRIDGFGGDPRQARAYLLATKTHLYVGVWSELPDEGGLLAEVQKDTAKMIFDDGIEIWIDPDPGAADGRRYQLMTNPLGRIWSRMHARGAFEEDVTWSAAWTVKSGIHDRSWHCEAAIAVDKLDPGRRVTDGAWLIDVWRNWKRPWKQAFMGPHRIVFSREVVPSVSLENHGIREEGEVRYLLGVGNPGEKPLTVKARLYVERDAMPELLQEQELTVAGGQREELALEEADQVTKAWKLRAEVGSAGGDAVWFRHATAWKADGRFRWITAGAETAPLDFNHAYYPTREVLRIQADASNLGKDAELQQLQAVVRARDGAVVKTISFDRLVDGRQEIEVSLPRLDGEYEIALKGTGKRVPEGEVVKSLLRGRYPWEGLNLGVTTRVFAPFTPMQVSGSEVRTVMRRHVLNGVGLWDQVEAEAQNTGIVKPILAAPMRYTVTLDGEARTLEADAPRVVSADGHRVEAVASFRTGAMQCDAALTWEVDGMMRVDLTLQPTGEQRLDELFLEIPFANEMATHIHAMGDGLRNTTNLELKRGKGVLWDSAGIPVNDLPQNFCSYIYLGTPVRGICWFAANDKGWHWDESTPNVVIERRGNETVLRVQLVNSPLVIDQPRTVTFGLQAAPVKPRLGDDWRMRWQRERYGGVLTSVNWGSFTAAASVYPPMKDMLVWEKLAKSNVKGRLPDREIDEVVAHYRPYIEQFPVSWRGRSQMAFWEHTVRHNLGGKRHGQKMVYYYNRSCHLLEDEFLTYQDEWGLHDWRPDWDARGTRVNHEIKIVPNDAFCDFHIYWYGKSFDVGRNVGVYWDNMFFRCSYNTETSMAYRRPDGSIRPSTGIWGLRELIKRSFNYMAERGMEPLTMPHMTSTMILPMYGFATVIYDLEWKYGRGSFQDKFPREYTLMATNGELVGAWPIVLGDRNYDELYTIPRSYTACLLVHDVYWAQDRAGASFLRPVRLLLGEPGVKVIRYWDEGDLPVQGSAKHVPWIVHYVPGKRALISLVNYHRGRTQMTLTLDPEGLGFDGPVRIRDAETFRRRGLNAEGQMVLRIPRGHEAVMLEVVPVDGP